jgi:outer membrane protein OmpA-like peptidoglycan-associated protein
MKRLITLLLLILLISSNSFPQRDPDDLKIGIQFNPFLPANEFPMEGRLKFSWLLRGIVRFGLADYLNSEIGAGYGEYKGEGLRFEYYKTRIYPVDFRLLIKFSKRDSYPYILLGAGVTYYETVDFPMLSPSPKEVKDKGFAGIAPAGLGYQFSLGRFIHMDINAGITFTTTDDLNYFKDGEAPDVFYFAGIGLLFGSNSPRDDDNDDLFNHQEDELGTDPYNPDTDGDGLTDGEEVMIYRTDPLKRDTDGDGLSDGDEVYKYKTDPLRADTDGDGLSDFDEIHKYGTDPLNPDTDGDGISDGEEILKYNTDPLKADTDGDGISDSDEIYKYKTDPLKADTDGDGLNDYEEIFTYRTDPLNKDTDGGSIMDGAEVRRGTDPINPDDDVMKIGKPVVFEGINFEFNSAEISSESEAILEEAYQTLINNPDITVEIAGHTDEIGSAAYNNKLSLERAEAVKRWLGSRGIDESRLIAAGYGKQKPVAPNDTPENRLKNRRIEFIKLK